MTEFEFTVTKDNAGVRLDKFLVSCMPDKTRSFLTGLIEAGQVLVNGRSANKKDKMQSGNQVYVSVPDPVAYKAEAENIPLDILYEDDSLLVVNKPKGMVVHPAAGNYTGTLVNALLYHCKDSLSGINGVLRPGIVHRIDKNTSGLLIVAKTDAAHQHLAAQIKEHSFTREYETVVFGTVKTDAGTVTAPIGRHPAERKKMAVTDKNAKHAVTHYEVLARYPGHTYMKCKLETGRTHQIRVHMAYIGHPVCGDDVYGFHTKEKFPFEGQCLHARKIGFLHPVTGSYMEFQSPLPAYFAQYLQKLERLQ